MLTFSIFLVLNMFSKFVKENVVRNI